MWLIDYSLINLLQKWLNNKHTKKYLQYICFYFNGSDKWHVYYAIQSKLIILQNTLTIVCTNNHYHFNTDHPELKLLCFKKNCEKPLLG